MKKKKDVAFIKGYLRALWDLSDWAAALPTEHQPPDPLGWALCRAGLMRYWLEQLGDDAALAECVADIKAAEARWVTLGDD